MFVSLNKKIIYSILFLFLITSLIFVYTFYIVYGNKIQEEQLYNIQRNQQYIDLLYKNSKMIKELRGIISANNGISISPEAAKVISVAEEDQLERLAAEQKQVLETNRSFDKRYTAIQQSLKILATSSILLILSIILLGYLITRWILKPLNKITAVSRLVSGGDLSSRINREQEPLFIDELDYLTITFNRMLDNLQNVISEVKDKESFLQSLIDSIPDGIRVIDSDYNIIIANRSYYRQAGRSSHRPLKCHQSSQRRNQPCGSEIAECPLRTIFEQGQKHSQIIQQFASAAGHHYSINAAPLVHNGKERYIVESIRDLSDDIKFSHQQKLSSLGFLSTSIAHEMKNQLGALRIILEHILTKFYAQQDDNAEPKKQLSLIYNELLNCISVPERLLKMSRSAFDAPNQPVACIAGIADVIAILDFEAKSKGMNIEFSPPTAEFFFNGNEADFKMVIINLILNALKAMSPGGIIRIDAKASDTKIMISFTDNGCGISPENLNRIFDPFFSDGRPAAPKGNGLGLSISKSIIEKLGGTILVKSTLGHGSCFTLSLPLIKNVAN